MKISTRKKHPHKKNVSIKKQTIHGSIIHGNLEGWKVIHIYGEPFERGFAHGYLLYKEIQKSIKTLEFLVKENIGISFSKYLKTSNRIMKPILKKNYPEYYEEIRGISAGARRKGADVSVDVLIAWNSYMSLYSYFNGATKFIYFRKIKSPATFESGGAQGLKQLTVKPHKSLKTH
jgi:hypothetical protein